MLSKGSSSREMNFQVASNLAIPQEKRNVLAQAFLIQLQKSLETMTDLI